VAGATAMAQLQGQVTAFDGALLGQASHQTTMPTPRPGKRHQTRSADRTGFAAAEPHGAGGYEPLGWPMSRHTLFAYVDGSDLDDIANAMQGRLRAFVEGRRWVANNEVWVVNQRLEYDASCSKPEDIPSWDLGLNLLLPDPGVEPAGWFADVEAIARFLGTLHEEFGRDFLIGITDNQTGIGEDLYSIDDSSPDVEKLAEIIGTSSIR
jgi:hypothetical protein